MAIACSRFEPGGTGSGDVTVGVGKWSEPKTVSLAKGRSNQNPVLFRPDPIANPGNVLLYHTSQAGAYTRPLFSSTSAVSCH